MHTDYCSYRKTFVVVVGFFVFFVGIHHYKVKTYRLSTGLIFCVFFLKIP